MKDYIFKIGVLIIFMITLKISLIGVVENFEETPSSQDRAFCRETFGAATVTSLPTEIEA